LSESAGTGEGVAALQEAGLINIAPLTDVPRLSVLGVFPTWQSVLAQLLMAELPPSEWSIDYDSLDHGEPHPVLGPVFMRKPALFSSGQACLP
jgi:hypothetical protein